MKRKTPYLYVVLALLAGAALWANPVRDVPRSGIVRDICREITDVPFATDADSAILGLSGMAYWVAGTETDSQNLTQLGSSGAGDAQFGSTSGADSNDPTSLPWYSTSDYDVTVDGVNYKYLTDNLVTNGTFDTDTDWTKGTGWTISDGVLNAGPTSSGLSAYQNAISSVGPFKVTLDVIVTTGSLQVYVGTTLYAAITTSGSYDFTKASANANARIQFTSNAFEGSIDNVVVREVTANLGDHVYLPGTSGNHLSHPDSAAVSVTGDITLQVEWSGDVTPSGNSPLIAKDDNSTNRSYNLWLLTGGTIRLSWSNTGSSFISQISSVAVPFSDNEKGYIRATMDVDNGSSQSEVKFWTSSDGETWSQLGTTKTGTVTSIYDGTAPVEIGSYASGTLGLLPGNTYSAHIWNSDIGSTATSSAGTPVMHWEASSMTQSGGADEESGSSWTINRSASGLKSTLVTRPVIVFNSAASTYLKIADGDFFTFASDEDFSWWIYGRIHGAPGSNYTYSEHRTGNIKFTQLIGASVYRSQIYDGSTAKVVTSSESVTTSAAVLLGGVRDVANDTLGAFEPSGSLTTGEDTTTGSFNPTLDFSIGARNDGDGASNLEFFAAGVLKGTSLSAEQLATLKTELDTLLQGRIGQ